jgi:Transposase, Mutator family
LRIQWTRHLCHGLGLGPSEAEPFWSTFLKGLVKRGLKGVKLVISDAHDGLRHAITRVLGTISRRPSVETATAIIAATETMRPPSRPSRGGRGRCFLSGSEID